ncbi:MAG: glycosyltransferase [Deltaproteobacteria bacterium]|nr:glycosyltransferase [Deltaproteobacteria bacterium]
MVEKPRIFYIDLFRRVNSNPYWLKAFQKLGDTQAFDIRGDLSRLEPMLRAYGPDHVHLGGSVKKGIIDPDILAGVKAECGCSISVFYGDARYSSYHCELAEVVDAVYINNKTHVRKNRELGYQNFHYLPCPTDPEVFRPIPGPKKYDVLFVGNNNSPGRSALLRKIHDLFKLTVVGRGWEGSPFNVLPESYGEDFSRIVGRARISLGLIDDTWIDLEACFSNRLVNMLACGAFFLQRYTPGLEGIFENYGHLVWYHTQDELISLIHRYLHLPLERTRIGARGREIVLAKFTYDLAVKNILQDSRPKALP